MNEEIPNIAADTVLEDIKRITEAGKSIARSRATWRKYAKAHKEGRVTDAQLENARNVLRESIANDLAFAFERGLHIGQGDVSDYEARGIANAAEIIR